MLECLLIIIIWFMGFCSDGADITFETHVLPLRMSKTTLSRYGWADLGTVSLSLSLSISGRLPLLSHLISLRRSLGNMLTQRTQGSYPKHGKVTRILTRWKLTTSTTSRRTISALSAQLYWIFSRECSVACTHARSRACSYTCSYAYSGVEREGHH